MNGFLVSLVLLVIIMSVHFLLGTVLCECVCVCVCECKIRVFDLLYPVNLILLKQMR